MVFIDAIHYSVRDKGYPVRRADGLVEIKEAIPTAFPNTKYKHCIDHQACNTLKYVSDKDRKQFTADLKIIYQAATEEAALKALYLSIFEAAKKWAFPIHDWGRCMES